jgi:sugar/nucleoside kinase (ribokinase family)
MNSDRLVFGVLPAIERQCLEQKRSPEAKSLSPMRNETSRTRMTTPPAGGGSAAQCVHLSLGAFQARALLGMGVEFGHFAATAATRAGCNTQDVRTVPRIMSRKTTTPAGSPKIA